MRTLLVIDNYDSFTYNLVQMFAQYDLHISVFRNDKISLQEAKALCPDYILVSPGPKDPGHSGISRAIIEAFFREVPILGVCLGMQCINEVFGGNTERANRPIHGKTSAVFHEGEGILKGIPSPFRAARYHSLVARVPVKSTSLTVTARTEDGIVMGISHRAFPVHGIQFHPESFMTEYGFSLAENFLALCRTEGPFTTATGGEKWKRSVVGSQMFINKP